MLTAQTRRGIAHMGGGDRGVPFAPLTAPNCRTSGTTRHAWLAAWQALPLHLRLPSPVLHLSRRLLVRGDTVGGTWAYKTPP